MVKILRTCVVVVLLLAVFLPLSHAAESREAVAIGSQVENFSLADFQGKNWSLDDLQNKKLIVVAFLGTECPLAKMYGNRLREIAEKYDASGVVVLGVFSNQQDSLAEISHYGKHLKIEFPLLKDPGNVVADQLYAARTPEIFLLDAERRIQYHGRVDDQYTPGIQRPKVQKEYLVDAIDALLGGKPVSTPQTEVVGCHIGRQLEPQADSDVTYSKQISRILNRRCVECHRPGEIGPFSLTSYEESVGWAAMIREVVEEQRMPPWHANSAHGKFLNDARLTDEEKQLIYDWVDAGAPEGDKSDLPEPPKFVDGWRIGTPDKIIYMDDKPFQVPAKGEVRYQYFTVDPGFTEDQWIQAAECRPGNRAVVHHIIVGIVPPGGRPKMVGDVHSEWLTATAPGAKPLLLPEGLAKYVPAGSKLVFQMHYTPNGTAQEDRSCVGFKFADAKTVKRQVGTDKAAFNKFEIPPGDGNHRVEAYHRFDRDMLMLAAFPHMHLRGKAFRYTAIYPSGEREILLDVPHYDFNWQNSYVFAAPKRMPRGTRLFCEAWFDNSEENPANPDPTATVRWGDQTWEEMMIGYFEATTVEERTPTKREPTRTEQFKKSAAQSPPQLSEPIKALARDALQADGGLKKLGPQLRTVLPQLDRICWTTLDEGKLHIRQCVQEPALQALVGGAGRRVDAALTSLAGLAEQNEPVIHSDLGKAKGLDLKFMARAFGSSVHIPVEIDGYQGTINFWSAEKDAFPPEAVALVSEVVQRMTAGAE